MRTVTFTSDFGLDDEFVGVCHAVIAGIAPDVRVIDLAHGPRGVRAGAAVLAQAVPYGPDDAVHLAVIDPGVGTERRPVALLAPSGALLVGPDNGLLVDAADALGGVEAAVELRSPAYRLEPVSTTFHGRDLFAPAAAHLASGVPLEDLGPDVDPDGLVRLPEPHVEVATGRLVADVLRTDRFGNVQLAATADQLREADLGTRARVHAGARVHDAVVAPTFAAAGEGGVVVHVDSAGRAAVAVRGGSAAALLGPVDRLTLESASDGPRAD